MKPQENQYEPRENQLETWAPLQIFKDGMHSITSTLTNIQQENRSQYHDVKQDLEIIKQAVVKPAKEKQLSKPLREPLTKDIFLYLLARQREPNEWRLSYSRFRVATVILWYTGLRLNEIRNFTRREIETLMYTYELQVYQPKVNKHKKVLMPPNGAETLYMMKDDIDVVFAAHETLSGTSNPLSWIRFMNSRLVKYTEGICENVRSHSFRVNYTTSLLKHAPLEQVAEIIGHRDIKTTLRYNRYRVTKQERIDVLVKAL